MNKQFFKTILLSLALSVTSIVFSDGKPTIKVDDLRAILAPAVARSTSIYGTIKNVGSEDDKLIGLSTDAGMIMLHKTEIKNGTAQMNHVDDFVLKAGDTLVLKPMSYHLMLMNINHDVIKKGGEVSLILEFEKAGKQEFKVPVLNE